MKVRCYPEGQGSAVDEYFLSPGDLGMIGAPAGVAPMPSRVSAALAKAAAEYAEEWDLDTDGTQNICVEPVDDDALALPGWHPAEEPTEYDDEPPRPFRLFVLTARVEVEWSSHEVASFNPAHTETKAGA